MPAHYFVLNGEADMTLDQTPRFPSPRHAVLWRGYICVGVYFCAVAVPQSREASTEAGDIEEGYAGSIELSQSCGSCEDRHSRSIDSHCVGRSCNRQQNDGGVEEDVKVERQLDQSARRLMAEQKEEDGPSKGVAYPQTKIRRVLPRMDASFFTFLFILFGMRGVVVGERVPRITRFLSSSVHEEFLEECRMSENWFGRPSAREGRRFMSRLDVLLFRCTEVDP